MRWLTKSLFSFCMAIALPAYSNAQAVLKADEVGVQAQISRDAEGFSACGIRAVVLVILANKKIDIYDFSVMIYPDRFLGLVKTGKTVATAKNLKEGSTNTPFVSPPPIKFLISKDIASKPLLVNKMTNSETPGFSVGVADLADTYDTILATAMGERMHFVSRYKTQNIDSVISFKAKMDNNELQSLQTCMTNILERMRAKAELQ